MVTSYGKFYVIRAFGKVFPTQPRGGPDCYHRIRFNIFFYSLNKGDFAWSLGGFENGTSIGLPGATGAVQVADVAAIFIPRASPIELYGFNIICLRNPKMCGGSFTIGLMVLMTDLSLDGLIFSTTAYNTSIVGSSVFVKDSNLVVVIRTVSRIWKVSAPASALLGDTLKFVQIIWSYLDDITIKIAGVAYTAPYTVVPHMPLAGDDSRGVIRFGGVDLTSSRFSFYVESYEEWLEKRIHTAGNKFPFLKKPSTFCPGK